MNDGGPAFPNTEFDLHNGHWEGRYEIAATHLGMSLRDWFAGQALQAITFQQLAVALTQNVSPSGQTITLKIDPETLADEAYNLADRLVARRTANPEGGKDGA